jgi:hypothetical protein
MWVRHVGAGAANAFPSAVSVLSEGRDVSACVVNLFRRFCSVIREGRRRDAQRNHLQRRWLLCWSGHGFACSLSVFILPIVLLLDLSLTPAIPLRFLSRIFLLLDLTPF